MTNYLGEIFSVLTAICWAITSTAFEHAGKKIGSLSLNIIRLWFAFIFLMIYSTLMRGLPLPLDASFDTVKWLVLSGFIGLVLGDLFLFEAFTRIGARISMLIFSSVPPMSAIIAYILLGDTMTIIEIIGMLMTILGIGVVILTKDTSSKETKVKLAHPAFGVLLAFGGAFCQSVGYIIGKLGVQAGIETYDAFAATQIRVIAAIIGFTIVITLKNGWSNVFKAFGQRSAMISTTIGSVFGPFIGVSLSLLAINYTSPGVAATLTSITPILLIPVAIFYHKETLAVKEVFGAICAIFGVFLMFL